MLSSDQRVAPPLQHGWLLLDKPAEMSSSAALGRLRRFFHTRRVGHAGTLDPFATGLLLVAVGRATRLFPHAEGWLKRYVFTVRWGQKTNTGDHTGEVLKTSSARPSLDAIQGVLPQFQGVIMQTPPAFSALKVGGRRSYALARAGQNVKLTPRKQHIEALRLREAGPEQATFEVVCDSGTYVRTLGEDIAASLGALGHLSALRRTAIGPWNVESACPLDLFEKNGHDRGAGSPYLSDPRTLLDDIPAVRISQEGARRLTYGQAIDQECAAAGLAFCVWQDRSVALVEYKDGQGSPRVVFAEKEL